MKGFNTPDGLCLTSNGCIVHFCSPGLRRIMESVSELSLLWEKVVSKSAGFVSTDSGVLFGLGTVGGGDGGIEVTTGVGVSGNGVEMGVSPGVCMTEVLEVVGVMFFGFGGDFGVSEATWGIIFGFGGVFLNSPPVSAPTVAVLDVREKFSTTVNGPCTREPYGPIPDVRWCPDDNVTSPEPGEPGSCSRICTSGRTWWLLFLLL